MDILRLRAHHIESLDDFMFFPLTAVEEQEFIDIYGSEMLFRIKGLIAKISDDTVIEIVEGNDDICNGMCPYATECREGRYQEIPQKLMDIGFRSDSDILRRSGLKVGEKYTFSHLKNKIIFCYS